MRSLRKVSVWSSMSLWEGKIWIQRQAEGKPCEHTWEEAIYKSRKGVWKRPSQRSLKTLTSLSSSGIQTSKSNGEGNIHGLRPATGGTASQDKVKNLQAHFPGRWLRRTAHDLSSTFRHQCSKYLLHTGAQMQRGIQKELAHVTTGQFWSGHSDDDP